MPETTRIRWEDIASPIDALASRGFVGKLERRSFIIYRPEFDGGQYRLLCLIGDRGGESLYADDPDELKRAAEEWLAGFVSSLGAVFPGSGEVLVRIEEEERPAAFFDEHDLAAIKAAAEPATTRPQRRRERTER